MAQSIAVRDDGGVEAPVPELHRDHRVAQFEISCLTSDVVREDLIDFTLLELIFLRQAFIGVPAHPLRLGRQIPMTRIEIINRDLTFSLAVARARRVTRTGWRRPPASPRLVGCRSALPRVATTPLNNSDPSQHT